MTTRGMDAGPIFNDRFSVSFMLALLIHAVVLLGIGFALDFKPLDKAADTLDVVLVSFQSQSPPEQAEFLAQAAQQGGGEEGPPEKPASELASNSPLESPGDMPFSAMEQLPQPAVAALETLTTQSISADPVPDATTVEQPDSPLPSAAQLMQQSMLADSLQPEAEEDTTWKSRLKRRKYISANTREYEFAAYMQAWVAKVERVGNLNYPVELRQRGISGSLLMTVGINRDGSVESINLARSSGIDELDQAAMRIVRLAAPYAPLPPEVTDQLDVLHITRTWRFSNNNRFDTR